MRKVRYEKTSISKEEKIFRKYTEDNVHYRRELGLVVVKNKMKNALKKPFRSYDKPNRLASVMISVDTKSTLDSAKRFMLKKIGMIKVGEFNSSPEALTYVERRLMEDDDRPKYGPHKWTKPEKQEEDYTAGATSFKKPTHGFENQPIDLCR